MESNTRGPAPCEPAIIKILLAFGAIYVIWGSTFLAIRFAVQTLPPLLMMGVRQLVAGILLFVWVLARGRAWPERRLWRHAFVAGAFCFVGCHGLLGWAELRVPSGLAALLAASLPIWMVLGARAWGQGSELTLRALSGIALGFIGVAVLVPFRFSGHLMETLSAFAVLLGELLWAIGAIYARGVKTSAPAATFAAMQMVCGGGLLTAIGLASGEASHLNAAAFTTRSVLSLLFLIVFGSLVAFTAYSWLLQVRSPAVVSTHSYVNPLIAVLLGWAMAGERVTARTMLGAVVILASIAVIGIRKTPAPLQGEIAENSSS
jgi:drug/metabolite transporter (DMT)-like permease